MRSVGVVGCGLMGRGIAEVAAVAGLETTVVELSDDLLAAGLGALERSLERAVEKGRLEAEEGEAARSRLAGATDLEALAGCDVVIEAIVERLDAKRELFASLADVLAEPAILASNTSSLSITELAMASDRPDRFLGLHFFNPVPVMSLVEVVSTLMTSEETTARGLELVERLGKTAVRCGDSSGFIVNRLLVPYLLDAVRTLDQGVGSREDIDAGMRLGCGHPMGPLQLLDFIGLDTTLFIAEILFEEFREARFAPPGLLKRMVAAGRHGRKSGGGFYDYD